MARRFFTNRASYEYFRDAPLRRLTLLLLAIFSLFGMLGFLIALIELRRKSLLEILVWTVFTGAMAVFYLLTLIRAPRWLPFPVAIHLAGSLLIRALIVPSAGDSAGKPIDEIGIRMAAVASLVLSVLAGGLFLQFIRSEGRRAVRLQTELSAAHRIQKTLVPAIEKTAIGCEFYGVSLPSDKVGGDLVDVVQLNEEQTFAYVADISGHGLPAGILMAMFKTAARTQLIDSPRLPTFLERLNEVLPQVKEPEMFATCAAMLLKRTNAHFTLEYSLAGHPPILVANRSSHCIHRLAETQFPLGLVLPVGYASRELELNPGDLFLITSDGVIETLDYRGAEFGIQRLEDILLLEVSSPLPKIAQNLLSAVGAFGKQADDQTILLFRVLA